MAIHNSHRGKKPEIGDKMYSVHEHMYYIPDHAGPVVEYCVCEATVTGFFTGGYTEINLLGPDPDGSMTPYFRKLSGIGKDVFYTPREAALLAQDMTEKYEKIWGWLGPPDIPMRRPWAGLLENGRDPDGGA